MKGLGILRCSPVGSIVVTVGYIWFVLCWSYISPMKRKQVRGNETEHPGKHMEANNHQKFSIWNKKPFPYNTSFSNKKRWDQFWAGDWRSGSAIVSTAHCTSFHLSHLKEVWRNLLFSCFLQAGRYHFHPESQSLWAHTLDSHSPLLFEERFPRDFELLWHCSLL